MENASKALIMAGGMLFAIIILSLLVIFFNNISGLAASQHKDDAIMQAVDFNKQFDAYERTVYGSELLSLANKVDDYNLSQCDNKGYTEVSLKVKITSDLSGTKFKAKSGPNDNSYYVNNKLKKEFTQEYAELQNYVDDLSSKKIRLQNANKSEAPVTDYTSLRKEDFKKKYNITKDEDYDWIYKDATNKANIDNYKEYNLLLKRIKEEQFICDGFTYDPHTGRITEMRFKK